MFYKWIKCGDFNEHVYLTIKAKIKMMTKIYTNSNDDNPHTNNNNNNDDGGGGGDNDEDAVDD
jgi:hypothetical protein